jgi:hypothetical protein
VLTLLHAYREIILTVREATEDFLSWVKFTCFIQQKYGAQPLHRGIIVIRGGEEKRCEVLSRI